MNFICKNLQYADCHLYIFKKENGFEKVIKMNRKYSRNKNFVDSISSNYFTKIIDTQEQNLSSINKKKSDSASLINSTMFWA